MILLFLACTDDPSTDSSPPGDSYTPPDEVELHGACPMATDFGGFTIVVEDTQTNVDGSVADGVVPISVLEEIAAEGDCRVLRRNNPFCEDGCDPGETCDFDGECITYPTNQDLGRVSIKGLDAVVDMDPVFPGNTYFNTSLPHPAYTDGATLNLSMPAGVYGPLDLYGFGVEPLAGFAELYTVEAGLDLEVSWTAPAGEVRSEVAMSINIDQHGTSPSTLHCTFEDDGSGTVPGAIIQALIDTGVTGFPSGTIQRRTIDSGTIGDGCMDFTVTSLQTPDVDVIGFTPCVSTEDCPEGQECNTELQICE
ncbi:MAG: hypothetical protein GY913_35970 [Proteobacteria bacterium]|nr:hypothetical protein [Pseudomonadota bacterium]MCP4922329.1 hypothetical protein [Pseudomonadota bacterium]